jgi:rhodanese-related sulfurtransferase
VEPPDPEVPRITIEEAKAAYDEGAAVFVDVRDASAYALGHVPGAVLMDLPEVKARLGELDPNQWIITYCT